VPRGDRILCNEVECDARIAGADGARPFLGSGKFPGAHEEGLGCALWARKKEELAAVGAWCPWMGMGMRGTDWVSACSVVARVCLGKFGRAL
jgi:hypothetical protein